MPLSFLEKIGPSTSRNLNTYLKATHLKADDLADKRILNLGAGLSNLEQDLLELGISSQVINLDINYISSRKYFWWNLLFKMRLDDFPNNAIRADMDKIPLKDKSVDLTFASSSMSLWLPYEKTGQALSEAIRVTKGNIYITPYSKSCPLEISDEKKSLVKHYYEDTETLVLAA